MIKFQEYTNVLLRLIIDYVYLYLRILVPLLFLLLLLVVGVSHLLNHPNTKMESQSIFV